MLGDIESDLEGDENERGFIIQQIARMRSQHNLSENPTERVRDFDSLLEGLGRLRNAKEFVHSNLDMDVPSRKKPAEESASKTEEAVAAVAS